MRFTRGTKTIGFHLAGHPHGSFTVIFDPLTVGKPGYADLVGVRDLRIVGDQLTALIQNADTEVVGSGT